MKIILRTIILILISLWLITVSAVFAEGSDNVITGFEIPEEDLTVDLSHKYVMVELRKQFPEQITILQGESRKLIEVSWKCVEDYELELDVFHFVPDLGSYTLADGVKMPVITVNILGKLEVPQQPPIAEDLFFMFPDVTAESKSVPNDNLPSYYNGYELGLLPPIRNQKSYNTCWAFATIACLEADLIHDGNAGTNVDLSELHLAYFTNHDFTDEKGLNEGDTIVMKDGVDYLQLANSADNTANFLTNMVGPVPESAAPYSSAETYAPSPDNGRMGDMQVTGFYRYNKNTQQNEIKQAILDHGAVAAVFRTDYTHFSSVENSYYYPTKSNGTNHLVSIVGWDDNFSADKFKSGTPEGPGAWLVRNSWGENQYGWGGYFWLSYYDMSLWSRFYAFDVEPSRYDHVYSYDNHPFYNYYTISSEDDRDVETVFIVDWGEQIEAVSFFTEVPDVSVTIKVLYGDQTSTVVLNTKESGFHVVPLSSPIVAAAGGIVYVSYTYNNDSSNRVYVEYSQAVEGPITYYYQKNGPGTHFDNDVYPYDAKIKLFTNDISSISLPAGLKMIESDAFAGVPFVSVKIPKGTTVIGSRAFADCPKLACIYIPDTVTDIHPAAFENVNGLTIVGISGSPAETYASEQGIGFIAVTE